MVSDKDRDQLTKIVDEAYETHRIGIEEAADNLSLYSGPELPELISAALIADGWGPRPVVYAESLIDFIGGGSEKAVEAAVGLVDFLRDRGIEVIE